MRILITGGCGFLGSHVVEYLVADPSATLVILDKLTYASAGWARLRAIGADQHPRVTVIGCDLATPIPEGVDREIGPIDYVLHTAAETHVDRSIVDPLPFIQSNVVGTHHLLTWARTRPELRRLIMVSTDEVYGPAGWDHPGFTEDARMAPGNPYAASKAGAEMLVGAYSNTFGLRTAILTTMNLFGERQHAEKFIPLVIRRVLAGERIHIHADATRARAGTRFYLHARSYAEALAWFMFQDETERVPERHLKLHIAGELEVSNLALAEQIAALVGRPLDAELVDFHSSRPGHDLRYALDDRAAIVRGWRPSHAFADRLAQTVRWYLDPANAAWLIP